MPRVRPCRINQRSRPESCRSTSFGPHKMMPPNGSQNDSGKKKRLDPRLREFAWVDTSKMAGAVRTGDVPSEGPSQVSKSRATKGDVGGRREDTTPLAEPQLDLEKSSMISKSKSASWIVEGGRFERPWISVELG